MSDKTPDPMEFSEAGGSNASIWLSSNTISAMIDAAAKSGRRETGGILVGRYAPEGWSADVIEATPKPRGSRSGWYWFQRSNDGLVALLAERWRNGQHYLGEWHFHPGGTPTPSGSDVRAMQKIARDGVYQCPSPILVIIGGYPPKSWAISATLFRHGHKIDLRGRTLG
ncbi:Mov34/MPN/PAD-1 family protein [Novosphingobium sp.]|uniref:Mov34/MPN/PAD-1 family protein n=1 Tax=Novosphingobium sp. TaxID=1874826 RepID=UPI002FDE11FB